MIEGIIKGADSIIGKFVPDKTKAKEFEAELNAHILRDKQSARDLQKMRLESKDPFIRRFVPMLALGVVSLSVLAVILLFFISIPERNEGLLNMALGSLLTGGFGLVLGFYFGSSQK